MLPKMVTEIAEFAWNARTQHFESRIYTTDQDTGERKLAAFYSTPAEIFLASFYAQGAAISDFDNATAAEPAEVINLDDARGCA